MFPVVMETDNGDWVVPDIRYNSWHYVVLCVGGRQDKDASFFGRLVEGGFGRDVFQYVGDAPSWRFASG